MDRYRVPCLARPGCAVRFGNLFVGLLRSGILEKALHFCFGEGRESQERDIETYLCSDVAPLGLAAFSKILVRQWVDRLAVANFCEDGDWANGISTNAHGAFGKVAAWVEEWCPRLFAEANKMIFVKSRGATSLPFAQIKVHRTCIFFKGPVPGSLAVND